MKRACLLAVIGAIAGLSVWGCATGRADDKKQIVIGFSQRRVAGSDWCKTLIAGATSEAEKLGVKIVVTDAGGDTVRQNSDVQTLHHERRRWSHSQCRMIREESPRLLRH